MGKHDRYLLLSGITAVIGLMAGSASVAISLLTTSAASGLRWFIDALVVALALVQLTQAYTQKSFFPMPSLMTVWRISDSQLIMYALLVGALMVATVFNMADALDLASHERVRESSLKGLALGFSMLALMIVVMSNLLFTRWWQDEQSASADRNLVR